MHRVLLGLAMGAALAAPASAKSFAAAGFSASAALSPDRTSVERGSRGVRIHRLMGGASRSDRDHRRSSRGAFAYGYPLNYYDANYDIDRNWESDSFNDWWHDRPDRAYPRWVWHNHNCSQDRMWWSGAGWRCTP